MDYKEPMEVYLKRKMSSSPLKPFTKREIHLIKAAFKAGFDWREWYEDVEGNQK